MKHLLFLTIAGFMMMIATSSCNNQPKVVSPIDVPNIDSLKSYVDKVSSNTDPKDLFFAGKYYLTQYTHADSVKGIDLLKKAAEQNYAFAANELGNIYSADSTNTFYDINNAVKYYELGVKNGSDRSMTNLANLYMTGEGVEINYAKALQLRDNAILGLLQLAESDDPAAQYRLGVDLADGIGIAKNEQAALKWIKKAAEKGFVPAFYSLGIYYLYGKGGLQVNDKEAFNYFLKAADKGNLLAMCSVAALYASGRGTDTDLNKSFEYYLKAANLGNAEAMFAVANAYNYGNGVEKNFNEAFKWNKKCADRGNIDAQNNIGAMYYSGSGVAQNYDEAFKWFMKAANGGSAFSQRVVGDCFYEGNGVQKDLTKAFEWYMKSAQGGDKLGMNRVARCYLTGEGVPVSEDLAMHWLRKSE